MLPILERLLFRPKDKATTRVLVLLPTRELAIQVPSRPLNRPMGASRVCCDGQQVFQVARKLAQFTNISICISTG